MSDGERSILLVDLDGPLADFDKGFAESWLAKHPGELFVHPKKRAAFKMVESYPERLQRKVRAIYTKRGFFRRLPIVPWAKAALRQLLAAGWRVYICTSPLVSYEHCVGEKYQWVEEHLGPDFVRRIIMTRDKTLSRGRFLIDDNPKISGAMRPAWEHILFDASYNREASGKRIVRWSDWEAVIGKP